MVPEDEDPITIMAREEMLAESARYEAKRIFSVESEADKVKRLCRMAVARHRAKKARRLREAILAGSWLALALGAAWFLIDKFL